MKLILGIPTINRADLLNEALKVYFENFQNTEIFIVDNGSQEIITRENNFAIYRHFKSLGVAESWNLIIDYADKRGATHVLMLNDDVVITKAEDIILALIHELKNFDFICSNVTWCSWIIKIDSFKKVGNFDENFIKCYYEDNDLYYRMKLLNFKLLFTDFLHPKIYRNSMTIAKDNSLNLNFEKNKQYYIDKWGGEPLKEKYITPFNK